MTAADQPTPQVGDTISTAAGLDTLPVGSGFVDKYGDLGLVDEPGHVRYAETAHLGTPYVARHCLPATVLFLPGAPQSAPTADAVERAARGRDGRHPHHLRAHNDQLL